MSVHFIYNMSNVYWCLHHLTLSLNKSDLHAILRRKF